MTGNIVWIASYPKSGNTWFRIFLTCLQNGTVTEADINGIDTDGIASARTPFEQCTGLDSTSLTVEEIAALRPAVYEHLSDSLQQELWIKVHDACQTLPDGRPLFPPRATRTACYLMRNPLDIAVSYANHNGHSLDRTIDNMNNPEWSLSKQILNATNQLPHHLGSWSQHVASWMESALFPVCLIRYEDMHQMPQETFGRAASAIGLDKSPEEIERAISASTFDKLKQQEQVSGFRERPHASKQFFRAGKIGSWRDSLSDNQAALIIEHHRPTMQRYGYLDSRGNPVF